MEAFQPDPGLLHRNVQLSLVKRRAVSSDSVAVSDSSPIVLLASFLQCRSLLSINVDVEN